MTRIGMWFTAILLLITAPAAGQQPNKGAAVVGRAAQVYRSLSSFRADFVQLINNPLVGLDSVTTRGTLEQAGEAKFAMRFSDPPREAIIMDGSHLWVYTPSTTPGQVVRSALPSGGPVYGVNILQSLLDRPAERYRTTFLRAETVGDRMTDVVELVPTTPGSLFDKAMLWIDRDNAWPRRVVTYEGQGVRSVTLSKIRVNERIPASAFTFTVPPKTRVVDQ